MIAGTCPRLMQGVAATLSWQPIGSDGEPATADPGTVTVGVVNAHGDEVIAAGTATSGTVVAPRTITVPLADMAYLDRLYATWKVGTTTVATTVADIVGGFYFTSADLRTGEPSTADPSRDPTPRLLAARAAIESLIEQVTGMAFVPRFATHRTWTSNGVIVLPNPYLRRVRWIRVWNSSFDVAPNYTELTVTDVTGNDEGIIVIPYEETQVEVGYEHGLDAPPADLRRAVLAAARSWNNMDRKGIPDRATSLQLDGGGVVTLATPGVGGWHTGLPDVDEVINRYAIRTPSTA